MALVLCCAGCAGLAYAIGCHVLQRTPTVLPGGTISETELRQVTGAANTSDAGRLAAQLSGFAQLQLYGPWHTLPDLVEFLGRTQFIQPGISSMETMGWCLSYIPKNGPHAGKEMQLSDLAQALTIRLLVSSCTKPQDPGWDDLMVAVSDW
jgi:hypothetical protein